MSSSISLATHTRRLAALAGPIVGAQIFAMSLWMVDVLMLGHVGVEPLGAASLGRLWVFGTLVFAMGLVCGIDPIASQAHGAGDDDTLGLSFQRAMVLAGLLTLPLAVSWLLTEPMLLWSGQEPQLAAMAKTYVFWQLPALPFFVGFFAVKQYLQAQGVVVPELVVAMLANVLNAGLNWLLIFGKWGFPALGLTGAAIATTVTQIATLLGLLLWMRRDPRQRQLLHRFDRRALSLAGLRPIVRYGWPVATQFGFEMWAFQLATLLSGWLGATALGAHTVAITLASVSFMMPLGIALAAVTRVGNLIGAGQPAEADRAAWVAFGLGGGVMALSGLFFYFCRAWLPTLFTTDPLVIATTAAILPVVAAFQVFDGLQVVGGGILRGMGQTRPAALANLLGYYVLALPLGWWLAFRAGLGVVGLWWGLALALAIVALLLVGYVRWRGPRTLRTPGAGSIELPSTN